MRDLDIYIQKAKQAIESRGWTCDEFLNEQGQCHLTIVKGDQDIGWGLFDRLYCWTEAFEKVTGLPWMSILTPRPIERAR